MSADDWSRFPPPTPEDWQRAVAGPGGQPARPSRWDGPIELPAVVRAADAPGRTVHAAAGWPRGGWAIGAELPFADPAAWNSAARSDLEDGLDTPLATLQCAVGDGGLVLDGDIACDLAFAGLDLARVPFGLDAGERGPEILELVGALARRRGLVASSLRGMVAGDPLARLARTGGMDRPFAATCRELVRVVSSDASGLSTLLADGTVYREAGATAVDELAFALASLAAQVRELLAFAETYALTRTAEPLPADYPRATAILGTPVLKLSAGMEVVMEVARLRAARAAAAQLLVAFGVPPARAGVNILLVPSRRVVSPLDAGNHLVRATMVALTGACGGADTVALDAHPVPVPAPQAGARRAARMAQLVLRVECGLDRTVDPMRGAFAVELLTRKLGEAAWRRFGEIESRGGLERALRDGWVSAELRREAAHLREGVTSRRRPIVGVSTSPDPREGPPPPPLPPPVAPGALVPLRDGAPFEALRRAAAAYQIRMGVPPRVLVALLGPSRDYRARAEWVGELFACGGFEVTANREFVTVAEAAETAAAYPVCVLTALDARYAADAPALAEALRAAGGATLLYVAGRAPDEPTEAAWRAAGVHAFAHAKANPYELLAALYRALGESVHE